MAESRHELTLQSSRAAAGEASLWVRALAGEHALDAERAAALDLCAVELVANIVDHAYAGTLGEIRLGLRISHALAVLTLDDDAPPFDLLTTAVPESAASLEEARIGGYGIRLVREFSDQLHYARVGGSNRLTACFGEAVQQAQQARCLDRRTLATPDFPFVRADGGRIERNERSGLDRRALGFISRSDLFANVPYDELERILAGCRIVGYDEGTLVLAAGQQSQRVWVVVEGSLRVHLDGPTSDDFLEIPCGECVGEISVADGKLSSAWVVAGGGCRLLEIEADTFLDRLLTIPQVGRNLIMILAERMRRSNQRISERVRLQTELEALQRELDFARRIQASMLPANPLFAEERRLDCHGFMRAARQVGGDFYEAMKLDEDTYLVAIGDVCNKGAPAALFMAQTLAMLRSSTSRTAIEQPNNLAELVSHGNDQLCQMNSEQLFVSLFIGVIDLATNELRYVNAGHNPPLLILPGQMPQLLDQPRNPVAGMVAGLSYKAGNMSFPVGSQLVLYTDGVTEAEAADLSQLGDDALYAVVAAGSGDAQAMVASIVARVDGFAAGYPQADDITLLALRRTI